MKKIIRCSWCESDELYIKYHDEEWGVPVHDDYKHFEFIILESAQAGLSWLTILKKRENYRKAFDNFDFEIVAKYDQKKIEKLMSDKGIIRNRRKIEAAISNAKAFIKVREKFGTFDYYIWKFVDFKPIVNNWKDVSQIPPQTSLSKLISKEMKKYGFVFWGPTIAYSYMQAVGLVNDHILSCFKRKSL
jgi:DNA-3-methyladenine glycosylase I